MADPKPSEEEWRSRWFADGPPRHISPSTRQILEEYSGIPHNEVVSHVVAIREEAWSHYPYPCIGSYRFLDLSLGTHSLYPKEILPRLRGEQGEPNQIFLDLGCAFGQDLRRLRSDGVSGSALHGCDIRLEFLDLGYKLFRDRERLGATFVEADIFASLGESGLGKLELGVDVINASSFFHLFTYAEQKKIAHSCLKLLKPRPGSLVVGRQMGDEEPGEKPKILGEGTHFRHSVESWRGMWNEVGEEAGGVSFQVEGVLRERKDEGGAAVEVDGKKWLMMESSVRRL